MKIFKKIFDHEYKELEKFKVIASDVMALDDEYKKLSDKQLKNKTVEFKKRLEDGETLEDIKVEAFATVREAAFRVIGEKPYYVQLVGGLTIHHGNIAEMKTGEGKTLTSTLPAYLNALTGDGVHIITVNEYLAGRDAEWMGNIYRFLGLTVGVNYRELNPKEKQAAYNCDIMYSTNNEIGFDYLRDNMVIKSEDRVQRPLNFVIVDEIDSVLIDEARTPLIISGGRMQQSNLYIDTDKFAKTLKENDGYIYDEKTRAVSLDETGIEKAEKAFRLENLYDINNTNLVHFINQALSANFRMKKDVDYVVEDGKILIVDQFTGRLMKGRNFSEGLHQAIEAKERVTINEETKTLATITFQNLFRMYKKLAGMTGTAKTEEEEFRNIYNMYVIQIPTNKPVSRIDNGDIFFVSQKAKYEAIVNEIKERTSKGQPVLVGTIAVETSEVISSLLKKQKIKHEILNAKNHEREAEIIAKAGEKNSVTIATNMAGRGTDIKLTEETKALGGLMVIGTERHESRRIDNQLRGRSGRQGDPGETQFCVSFEDDLMRRFGGDRFKTLLARVDLTGDLSLRLKPFAKFVENAQKKVEGNNFDTRKHLIEYDDVINKHREIAYKKRNLILDTPSVHEVIINTFKDYMNYLVYTHSSNNKMFENNLSELLESVNELFKDKIEITDVIDLNLHELEKYLNDKIEKQYEEKIKDVPEQVIKEIEKATSLRLIDMHWMTHINTMSHLIEGIGLRSYAQNNPLRAYTNEGYELLENMLDRIDKDITYFLIKSQINQVKSENPLQKIQTNQDLSKTKKSQPKKVEKIGRNEQCPCGSGKKYKQCCGR